MIGNTLSDSRPYKFVLRLNKTEDTNSTTSILESPSGLVALVLALQEIRLDFYQLDPISQTRIWCWSGYGFESSLTCTLPRLPVSPKTKPLISD